MIPLKEECKPYALSLSSSMADAVFLENQSFLFPSTDCTFT